MRVKGELAWKIIYIKNPGFKPGFYQGQKQKNQ